MRSIDGLTRRSRLAWSSSRRIRYRTLRLSEQGREVVSGRVQDVKIKRPSMPVGLSAYRRYRDDLPHELRAELRFRRRTARFGPWDTDPW